MTPKKQTKEPLGNKIANGFVGAMATWRFIFLVLLVCIVEIWGNQTGFMKFDKTMIVLNTALSLWAAVQGSIIMINQNEADKKRDAMMKKILQLEQKQLTQLKGNKHDETKTSHV